MKKYRIKLIWSYHYIEFTELAESRSQALAQIEARLLYCLDEYAVIIYEPKKSIACSEVLQMMDNDFSYENAVGSIVAKYGIDKKELEEELNLYI